MTKNGVTQCDTIFFYDLQLSRNNGYVYGVEENFVINAGKSFHLRDK